VVLEKQKELRFAKKTLMAISILAWHLELRVEVPVAGVCFPSCLFFAMVPLFSASPYPFDRFRPCI